MKWLFIALPIILLMFIISSNELSSNSFLNNEQSDSYKACIKLKRKAPYFNLKCEHLLNNPLTPEKARKKETKSTSNKEKRKEGQLCLRCVLNPLKLILFVILPVFEHFSFQFSPFYRFF